MKKNYKQHLFWECLIPIVAWVILFYLNRIPEQFEIPVAVLIGAMCGVAKELWDKYHDKEFIDKVALLVDAVGLAFSIPVMLILREIL